jgi:hypothetical protein
VTGALSFQRMSVSSTPRSRQRAHRGNIPPTSRLMVVSLPALRHATHAYAPDRRHFSPGLKSPWIILIEEVL